MNIADNVKVAVSQVLLECRSHMVPNLNHVVGSWIGWVAGRGVVDNLTRDVLTLFFSHQITFTVSTVL